MIKWFINAHIILKRQNLAISKVRFLCPLQQILNGEGGGRWDRKSLNVPLLKNFVPFGLVLPFDELSKTGVNHLP